LRPVAEQSKPRFRSQSYSRQKTQGYRLSPGSKVRALRSSKTSRAAWEREAGCPAANHARAMWGV
jgi:hypothetical protein